VVLDFSRHLNRVLAIDPEQRTALVEPGAVLDAVNTAAAPHGPRFGPDPSTHARATVGGSLANNACGSRALGYGRSADNVVSLDVATIGGERFTADRLQDAPPALRDALQALVRSRLAVIRTEFGRFSRQSSGYALEHLLPGEPPRPGRPGQVPGRLRGHPRGDARCPDHVDRQAEGGRAGRAGLSGYAGRRRRRPRAAAAPAGGAGRARLAPGRRGAAAPAG